MWRTNQDYIMLKLLTINKKRWIIYLKILIEHAIDNSQLISEPSLYRVPEDISEDVAKRSIKTREAVIIPKERWNEFLDWYNFKNPEEKQTGNLLERKRGIYSYQTKDVALASSPDCHGISLSIMQHVMALSVWDQKLTQKEVSEFKKLHNNKKLQKYLNKNDHPIFSKSFKHFFAECFARYYSQGGKSQSSWHYKKTQDLWNHFPEIKNFFDSL